MNNSMNDSTLNEFVESLKIHDTSGTLAFSQLKASVYDKESLDITSETIFGKQIGNKYPYFIFNTKFDIDSLNIKFIAKVPAKILLENILLLNTLWKKPGITEEAQIQPFVKYILSRFRIRNAMYDFYSENLKILAFFSSSLFEEIIKVMISENIIKPKEINRGETDKKVGLINTIICDNIKSAVTFLTKKLHKYTISGVVYGDNNIYQISNGIIVMNSTPQAYMRDYDEDLKSFNSYKSKTYGNFYIFVKSQSKQTDVFFGDFNCNLKCSLAVFQPLDEESLCERRRKNINTYRIKLFGGSTRKRSKRFKRSRKPKLKQIRAY